MLLPSWLICLFRALSSHAGLQPSISVSTFASPLLPRSDSRFGFPACSLCWWTLNLAHPCLHIAHIQASLVGFLWSSSLPKHTPNHPHLSHTIPQSQTFWMKILFSKQFISLVNFPASEGWNEPQDFQAKQFLKTEILLKTVPIYFPSDSNHFSSTKHGLKQYRLVLCPFLHDPSPLLTSELACKLEVLGNLNKDHESQLRIDS